MHQLTSQAQPRLWSAAKAAALILLGVAFVASCAKVRVPFWPVPMTLQTFATMVIALAVGPRLAASTFVAYLAIGAAGFPVFAGTPDRGIGLAYMAGPTGGYLLGFVGASWLVAALAQGRGVLGRIAAMLAGLATIHAAGLCWLALHVPTGKVLALGFLPFVVSDLTSIAVVAIGSMAVPSRLLGRIGR
ncbi:MAG: biotin transporter BioY [Pseudomonadota bacterium]